MITKTNCVFCNKDIVISTIWREAHCNNYLCSQHLVRYYTISQLDNFVNCSFNYETSHNHYYVFYNFTNNRLHINGNVPAPAFYQTIYRSSFDPKHIPLTPQNVEKKLSTFLNFS